MSCRTNSRRARRMAPAICGVPASNLYGTTWNVLPYKFEAGTPHIAGAVGLGAAIDYVRSIGFDAIGPYEAALLEYGTAALQTIPGLRLVGTARHKSSVLSFVMEGIHPHDIGTIVD